MVKDELKLIIPNPHEGDISKSLYHVRLITYKTSLRAQRSGAKQSQGLCDCFSTRRYRERFARNDKYLSEHDIIGENIKTG